MPLSWKVCVFLIFEIHYRCWSWTLCVYSFCPSPLPFKNQRSKKWWRCFAWKTKTAMQSACHSRFNSSLTVSCSVHSDESAIHIKTFRDIPLGDLDVIFPAQKILFKTVDFVRLGLTAVLGLYFALHAFSELFSDEGVDSTALAACIGECLCLFLLLSLQSSWSSSLSNRFLGVRIAHLLGHSMERRHVPHRAQRNTLQKVGRQSSRRDFVPDGGTRGTIRLISTCDIVVLTRACVCVCRHKSWKRCWFRTCLRWWAAAPSLKRTWTRKRKASSKKSWKQSSWLPPKKANRSSTHFIIVVVYVHHHSFCCLFRMPSVDFEVDDAVDKLARLGLARVNGDKGQ